MKRTNIQFCGVMIAWNCFNCGWYNACHVPITKGDVEVTCACCLKKKKGTVDKLNIQSARRETLTKLARIRERWIKKFPNKYKKHCQRIGALAGIGLKAVKTEVEENNKRNRKRSK